MGGTALASGQATAAQDLSRPRFEIPDRPPSRHPDLEMHLEDDLAAQRAAPSAERTPGRDTPGAPNATVVVEATDTVAARAAIEGNGGRVLAETTGQLEASVPARALGRLADDPSVSWVREPYPARAEATSQGVVETGADAWHTATEDGAGTKVAIVDIGFSGYAARLGTELPATVETDFSRCTSPLAETHGTAVSEIVHDMAPGATLRLVCVRYDVDFADALASLAAAGVDIANGSIGFTLTGRGDGAASSNPAAAVAALRDQGVLYVGATGNYGGRHYHQAAMGDTSSGDDFTDFVDLTADDILTFTVPANGIASVSLRWDGWPTTYQDFDLFVGNDACGFVGSMDHPTNAPRRPVEYAVVTNCTPSTQVFQVVVNRYSGNATPRLDLFFDGAVSGIEASTGSNVAEPATSPAVLAVGAHCWSNGALEPYSSSGPTIDERVKPDLSGPDATTSSVYGLASGCSAGFRGTSAASPHVAGAAAILLGANPDLDLGELEQLLKGHAAEAGTTGPDNSFGYGLLRLGAAGDVSLPTPQPMTPTVPVRLFDSRPGTLGASEGSFGASGRTTPLPVLGDLRVSVRGIAGVPVDATAVVLNVTVTEPTLGGYLTVHPGTNVPNSSNLNFSPGQTVAQHVTATVGADGKVGLFNGSAGTTHVILDLAGWYGPTGSGGPAVNRFVALDAPARALDSRPGTLGYAESAYGPSGRTTPIPTGGSLDVQVAGLGGVPANAAAVMVNLTVTNTSSGGHLLVYPSGASQPLASSLNYTPSSTIANLVVVPVGASGNIRIAICCSPLDVVVDVAGWYLPDAGAGYVALDPPVRDLDTRVGNGPSTGPIGANGTFRLEVARYYGVPADAKAVMLSVAVVQPTANAWLTVFPGSAALPSTSNLNFVAGAIVPNAVVSGIGTDGTVAFHNPAGSTPLISDLSGFFIDPADVGAPVPPP